MASQDSKINSTNVGVYDHFGSSVRLCGKGNGSYNTNVVDYRAIVRAPNNEYIGNVYIFRNMHASFLFYIENSSYIIVCFKTYIIKYGNIT